MRVRNCMCACWSTQKLKYLADFEPCRICEVENANYGCQEVWRPCQFGVLPPVCTFLLIHFLSRTPVLLLVWASGRVLPFIMCSFNECTHYCVPSTWSAVRREGRKRNNFILPWYKVLTWCALKWHSWTSTVDSAARKMVVGWKQWRHC